MEPERIKLTPDEEQDMERRALEDLVREQGPDVLDNSTAVEAVIESTEPMPQLEAGIERAAVALAETHGISVEEARRRLAKRAIEIFIQEKEE